MTSEDLKESWIACDKCGVAKAKYLVKLVSGELYFCSHHLSKFKADLDKLAYEIIELDKKEEVPQLIEERI
jgi:hypothetical protein